MEKRISSYSLDEIKQSFNTLENLRITASALHGARSMGFTAQDIVNTIQQLKRANFVKSMTTFNDHTVWQDVYNCTFNGYELYIKFQKDELGHFVISFKEK